MTRADEKRLSPLLANKAQFVGGVALSGVGAAMWFPESPGPGVFIPLIGLFGAFALWGASSLPDSWFGKVTGVMAFLLLSTTAFRASPWLAVLNVLGATGLAALAVGDAKSWGQVIRSGLAPAARLVIVPKFLLRSVVGQTPDRGRTWPGLVRGLSLGLFLVLIFGTLFASADFVFGRFLAEVFDVDLGLIPFRIFLFVFSCALVTGFCLAHPRYQELKPRLMPGGGSFGPLFEAGPDGRPIWRIGRSEWAVALGMLNVLFVGFVVVQLTVLFGGRDHVLETEGLTYAEYARSGFFELVFASMLTLGVVVIFRKWAAIDSESDDRLSRALLGGLCVCTFVILGSAFKRLGLYEDAFGFTIARLLGHTFIIWLAIVFWMVCVAGAARKVAFLPRALVLLAGATLLTLTAINPEAFIAGHNVDRYLQSEKIDLDYFSNLGPDAASEADRLPASLGDCAISLMMSDQRDREPWSSFNVSRSRARGRDREPSSDETGVICPSQGYTFSD